MIGKPKVTFIFDPSVCAACQQTTEGRHVTLKTLVDGIERRFPFCARCIDGDPTEERCRELLRRTIGMEDAIARGEEEAWIKSLL